MFDVENEMSYDIDQLERMLDESFNRTVSTCEWLFKSNLGDHYED